MYRVHRGLHIPNHLFVQDADEEEPLARSHSHPGLARTERVALLQSIEALEAFMSWTEKTGSQWNSKATQSCPAGCVMSFNKESRLTLMTIFTELSDEHNFKHKCSGQLLRRLFTSCEVLWFLRFDWEWKLYCDAASDITAFTQKPCLIIRSEETWLTLKPI